MDVEALSNLQHLERKKRKRDGFDGTAGRSCRKKPAKSVSLSKGVRTAESSSTVRHLLDLPTELLIEIFVLSTNAAFPATCKHMYNVCFADPKINCTIGGPPLWLQHRFIENFNPFMPFAIQKCLRRRFFGPDTLKAYLPDLFRSGAIESISVPLRCITNSSKSTRELLLYTELFLNGVTLSSKSRNKALVYLATNDSHVDPEALFWKSTKADMFDRSSILRAFKGCAHKQFFDHSDGTFDFLVQRFGIDEDTGYQLYDMAARRRDKNLIDALQYHHVRPGMDALKLLI